MSKQQASQTVSQSAGATAVQEANDPGSEIVENLKQLIPSAKQLRVNLLTDVWVDKATNVREVSDNYSDEELDDFSKTIRSVGGLLHPIYLIPIGKSEETDNKPYGLLHGFRRTLTLLRMAEQETQWAEDVPAVLVDEADSVSAQTIIQLIENLARKNLTYLEQAKAIEAAMKADKTLRQKDMSLMLGMSESDISKLLKLNRLPEAIQQKLASGEISYSHAQTILYTVPESAWTEAAKAAGDMTFSDFDAKMQKLYRSKSDATEATAEGTAGAAGSNGAAKEDSQKRTTTLKATELENTYIPFLRKQLETADKNERKYTEADLVQARLDTVQTVTLKADTTLAKDIAPFLVEQTKAAEEAKKNKDANDKKEHFYKELVKDVHEVLNAPVDPLNPSAQRPTLANAYGSVVQKVMRLDDEAAGKLGFPLKKDAEEITRELSTAYVEDAKQKREDREKREAKKAKDAADKAKADAEAAAKAAGGATAEPAAATA